MSSFIKILKSYAFYLLSAFGIALTIKANIGISSFNAMNVAISSATSIKVGTITMLINIVFLLIYMHLTKYQLKSKYVVQLLSVFLFGSFINFFTYTVLGSLVIESYALKVITILFGTLIGGIAVGMIVNYNAITFPIESVCLELSNRTKYSFTKLRYSVDVISIIVSLSVSFAFALPYFVREGTLISLLLFSLTIGFVKSIYAKKVGMSVITDSQVFDLG